jgi:hypothetical protein
VHVAPRIAVLHFRSFLKWVHPCYLHSRSPAFAWSIYLSILYYKERRQLKIFSHSIRTHLTPHARPTRYIFWKWIRCKDYKVPKNRNLESVYAKKGYFFSPSPAIHACGIRWAHPSRPRSVKKFPFPAVETSPARRSPLQQRVRLVRGGGVSGLESRCSSVRTATTTTKQG